MNNTFYLIINLFINLCLFGQSNEFLITRNSVGQVSLGMTMKQAFEVLQPDRYERSGSGDSGFHTYIKEIENILFSMSSDSDQNYFINPYAKIEYISIFNEKYQTNDGVHAGMLLKDVEKKWGKLKEIVISDANSAQYAYFEKAPNGLSICVHGGTFQEGFRRTSKYEKNAKIHCIGISTFHY